ncbi:MAG TPA: hypothetical protein VEA37_00115, partial [Flavobacterium sp.]|nr:hypothetical protein [Flavobacterium sp.]
VLLYLSADSGTYYHQKYMYNDVYKTKDGGWAGTYARNDYNHPYNKYTTIKPIKIDFIERVAYLKNDEYSEPYFKTVGDSVIAMYGNYVDELFTLKRNGFLTARGMFEATPEQDEALVESMQPEKPATPPTTDDLRFIAFWKIFVQSVSNVDRRNFKDIALDTLYICDSVLSAGNFIDKCFNDVIDDEVKKRIVDETKLEYTFSEIELSKLLTSGAKKEIIKIGDRYRLRQMQVTRSMRNNNPPVIVFNFIETQNGYRLYGIDHYWSKECCQ